MNNGSFTLPGRSEKFWIVDNYVVMQDASGELTHAFVRSVNGRWKAIVSIDVTDTHPEWVSTLERQYNKQAKANG